MNPRIIFATLLCAFAIGDSRAGTLTVDGEPCVVPNPTYVHIGTLGSDRFMWFWCATRYNRYWTMSLDPLARAGDVVIDMSPEARAAGGAGFIVTGPVPPIGWGEPATADLERAATNAAAADTHRPPIPPWKVQSNGTSKTRPGYVITDGKRSSTAAAERVPVGVACDCREKPSRAIEGKSTYCVVPGVKTPLLGALCTPGAATATIPEPPKPPPVVQPPVITPPPVTPTWTKIASEGQTFSVAEGTVVRYGLGEVWVQKTVSGAGACTTVFFGKDPVVGVTKQCQVEAASPAAGPGLMPPTNGTSKSVSL